MFRVFLLCRTPADSAPQRKNDSRGGLSDPWYPTWRNCRTDRMSQQHCYRVALLRVPLTKKAKAVFPSLEAACVAG